MDLGRQMDGGFLPPIPPAATLPDVIAVVNDVITRLNNSQKVQVFADVASKRYVQGYVKGRWPGGDFGIAISKPGENVLDVEFEDLLFAWDFTTNNQYFNGGVSRYVDPATGKDYAQIGILPDSSGGVVVAKPGESVDDAYAS